MGQPEQETTCCICHHQSAALPRTLIGSYCFFYQHFLTFSLPRFFPLDRLHSQPPLATNCLKMDELRLGLAAFTPFPLERPGKKRNNKKVACKGGMFDDQCTASGNSGAGRGRKRRGAQERWRPWLSRWASERHTRLTFARFILFAFYLYFSLLSPGVYGRLPTVRR